MSYMPARYFTLSHEPYKLHWLVYQCSRLVDTSLPFSTSHTSHGVSW